MAYIIVESVSEKGKVFPVLASTSMETPSFSVCRMYIRRNVPSLKTGAISKVKDHFKKLDED